nr:hypothetical protein [Tanacetum cinerariifolium]
MEEETEEYSIGWEIRERVCPHASKAVTRATAPNEQNPFPKNITMKEHVQGGQKCSSKVKNMVGEENSRGHWKSKSK